ncbi:MAG: histone deacetylase family protein [Pseudorhodoplanes sp.]
MTTLLVTHPDCLNHLTGPGHPERPDRLRAVEKALADARFAGLLRIESPLAALETIGLCHPMDYVTRIRDATPAQGVVRIDADTVMSPGSFNAALRCAGGAVLAVDHVLARKAANAFVATRPPGHHAETAHAMGFCLFNNAAIAARHAQMQHGLNRVAIVDFDVHHGNGTQDIFWSDPTVLYCSTHEMPLYPGTGLPSERGAYDNIVNVPLRAGDGGTQFRDAMSSRILPRLNVFRPELLIISAGFDAHHRDPLANLQLTEEDFGWATRELMAVADVSAGSRIVSVLEGGYDLEGLAQSAAAHVSALMSG